MLSGTQCAMLLKHVNGSTMQPPFTRWYAVLPDAPPNPWEEHTRVSIFVWPEDLEWEQKYALVASPKSFQQEAKRELEVLEQRVIEHIRTSSHVKRQRYMRVGQRGEMDYVEMKEHRNAKLSAEEKDALIGKMKAELSNHRAMIDEHHEAIHRALLNAFPVDKFFAEELE